MTKFSDVMEVERYAVKVPLTIFVLTSTSLIQPCLAYTACGKRRDLLTVLDHNEQVCKKRTSALVTSGTLTCRALHLLLDSDFFPAFPPCRELEHSRRLAR